jgi:ABC-2 family transporter
MSHSSNSRLIVVVALIPVLVILALAAFAWPSANLAPRDLPVGVVASAADSSRLSAQIHARFPGAFSLRSYSSASEAQDAIRNREVYGAVVLDSSGNALYVASASSALVTQLLTQELLPVVAAQPANGQPPHVVDVVPAAVKDPGGLALASSVLPLVLAGLLTGLLISLLSRPGLAQVGALVATASLAGLAAVAVAQGWLGALNGNWLANAGVFALTILAIASVVAGLGALLGVAGLALGALLIVFVGNPFSGVATSPGLLPPAVGVIGQLMPPGAGGNLLRSTAFFGGAGGGGPLAVLCVWILLGLAMVAVDALLSRGRITSSASK